MGTSSIPFVVFTSFWLLVGGVAPWFVPKDVNRGIIQTMLVTTAVCCYLFWLCCYMVQMNPFYGPQLSPAVLSVMKLEWK